MNRRDWLWLGAAAWGCGARSPQPDLLPEELGGWRRKAVRDVAPSDAPPMVPRSGVKRIREADYDGPGSLTARVYELNSDALALDLAQRWPPRADTVAFHDKNHFAVITWSQADRQALKNFVRELERKLAL